MEFIQTYSDEIVDDCPWGDENVGLSNKRILVREKIWLARQIVENKTSISELKIKYKLGKSTLHLYDQRFRKKIQIQQREGRPKCLDEDSYNSIITYMQENDQIEEDDLRDLIRSEASVVGLSDTQKCCGEFVNVESMTKKIVLYMRKK